MSIKELETAVATLSQSDLRAFARWFDEFRADEWDKKIEDDIQSGKLDNAGRRADADFESGRCTPL